MLTCRRVLFCFVTQCMSRSRLVSLRFSATRAKTTILNTRIDAGAAAAILLVDDRQCRGACFAKPHLPGSRCTCTYLWLMLLLTRTRLMGCLSAPRAGGRWLMFSRPAAATCASRPDNCNNRPVLCHCRALSAISSADTANAAAGLFLRLVIAGWVGAQCQPWTNVTGG